ncbi:MAG: DNA polymerase subunit beta [Epsilonproteobacteria bacterium]|nr:DNA polymerase subunit beta [Campylobacterota bacterium]NPA89462.1 nucleotidyltransferase domain-containing protein [Campylobacterota bacterium]
MRLTAREREIIRREIEKELGRAKIYLFGSQLDSTRRGGDIDLFIVPLEPVENIRTHRGKLKWILEEKLLKPVDIVIHRDFSREIEQEGLRGVEI